MATQRLKRKEIKLVLKEANSARLTVAVLVRCQHYPDGMALMSVETMIKHARECPPDYVATDVPAMEAHVNAIMRARLKAREGNGSG